MLYLLLFFSGAIVFINSNMLFYLLLSTGSSIPGTFTWDCCCCICFFYMLQYCISWNSHLGLLLLYLLLLTGVVAYDVVHRFQYFQELSTGDEVAISAAVNGFCGWCSRMLFTGSKMSMNSHLGVVLLCLLLFTGSNISRNSYLGWWCLSAVFLMFQYFQGLTWGWCVSAAVYRF
jgi:hypothetical protein